MQRGKILFSSLETFLIQEKNKRGFKKLSYSLIKAFISNKLRSNIKWQIFRLSKISLVSNQVYKIKIP